MSCDGRPSEQQVLESLDKILSSAAFARSERLRAFLKYVVEKELEGIGHQLKGYTIGVDVFDRPLAFNADSDPLVRVHAGKLRKLMAAYYAGEGRQDEWRIEIPKGTYVPQYICQTSSTAAATAAPLPQSAPIPTGLHRQPRRRFSWLPKPLSSPRALMTMLPLLIFLPLSSLAMNVTLPAQSRLHGAVFERKFGTDLPRLTIRLDGARNGTAANFAEALRAAASHYATLAAPPPAVSFGQRPVAKHDALAFTITVSGPAEQGRLKVAVLHDASQELIYDGFIEHADLASDADILYESLAVASRMLSADGHVFRFAANAGIDNTLMRCMTATDIYRAEQTRKTFAQARECQEALSAEHRRKLNFVISANAIPTTLMR